MLLDGAPACVDVVRTRLGRWRCGLRLHCVVLAQVWMFVKLCCINMSCGMMFVSNNCEKVDVAMRSRGHSHECSGFALRMFPCARTGTPMSALACASYVSMRLR